MAATISPKELLRIQQSGKPVELIDVRTPAEFGEIHVSFARNVPLDRLDPQSFRPAHATSGDQPLYVICRSGSRSKQACEKLIAAGVTQVISVDGGTQACQAEGLPVTRGKKAISLERQVRIAAGMLVVAGSVLGYLVHPYWIGLSAFVGAGLIFAGVTDTCGMAMCLARMPWNQVSVSARGTCKVMLLLAVVMGSQTVLAAAIEHTRDGLDVVKHSIADKKAVLVDVREIDEWDDGHLQGAIHVPLSLLEGGKSRDQIAKALPKDKIIYCHCKSGRRALKAARVLQEYGYDVRPLAAGYKDLLKAGFSPAEQ